MKKYLALLLLLPAVNSVAQDIHFSQFYENAIMRNPALTGIFSGDYKVGANYRTQWSNISVPFQTFLVSAETRVATNRAIGDYLSFGVAATYDKAGSISFNSMQVYPALNYNKSLEDKRNSYLSVGFAGGYIQRSIDFSKATFSSQYVNGSYSSNNPSGENFNNTTLENYDVAAGVSLNSSAGPGNIVNYYVGFSAFHLNKPKQTFDDDNILIVLAPKYTGNIGFSWRITNQFGLTAHMDYSKQATYTEMIGGGMLSWQTTNENSNNIKLYAGLFIRRKDAIIPTFKLDYSIYSLTFTYDVNNSGLKTATSGAGGYELSLFLRGRYKKADQYGPNVNCPRFDHMLQGDPGLYN
ncbi:MAG: PorP/SprF family type IX secretion system membrane protein [Chitinophagaceae bacterium]|nr:PorP/SprF family type IX secretion system membrane protein [Chitinophagaceae bacterium]MCB9044641.1 PorP/SprF family type IX secretion system membrane protein [Chitinophagales bacterium]